MAVKVHLVFRGKNCLDFSHAKVGIYHCHKKDLSPLWQTAKFVISFYISMENNVNHVLAQDLK